MIGWGVSILWGVENWTFPLTKPVAVNTGLGLPRSLWFYDRLFAVIAYRRDDLQTTRHTLVTNNVIIPYYLCLTIFWKGEWRSDILWKECVGNHALTLNRLIKTRRKNWEFRRFPLLHFLPRYFPLNSNHKPISDPTNPIPNPTNDTPNSNPNRAGYGECPRGNCPGELSVSQNLVLLFG